MTKHFDVLKNVEYNFYHNDNFQIKCYHDYCMIKSINPQEECNISIALKSPSLGKNVNYSQKVSMYMCSFLAINF